MLVAVGLGIISGGRGATLGAAAAGGFAGDGGVTSAAGFSAASVVAGVDLAGIDGAGVDIAGFADRADFAVVADARLRLAFAIVVPLSRFAVDDRWDRGQVAAGVGHVVELGLIEAFAGYASGWLRGFDCFS
jgi:hypothetical protein